MKQDDLQLDTDPYRPPQSDLATSPEVDMGPYPGIPRLPFLGISLLLLLFDGAMGKFPNPYVGIASTLLTGIGFFIAIIYRLKNMGSSGWWALFYFVPVFNIVLIFRCFAFQEGFKASNTLDTPGKVMAGLMLAFIAGLGIAIVVGGVR